MRLTTLRLAALGAAVLVPATVLIAQDQLLAQAPADPAPIQEQIDEQLDPNPSGEQSEPTAAERAAAPRDPLEIYADLNLFGEIFDRIRAEYVDPPNEQELIRAAIQGMLTSLDPHSSFLNEKNFRDMQVQTKGEFGGLGIEVRMEEGAGVRVVRPMEDTPAFRAGVLPGDLIDEGADKLHFYTLNRPELTRDVCHALGVTPKLNLQNVA